MTPMTAWMVRVGAPFVLLVLVAGTTMAASAPANDNRIRGKKYGPLTLI